MLPFLAATFVGATMWNTFLLICGMKLRNHWIVVQKYSHQADYVIVAVLIVLAIWFYQKRRHEKRLEPGESPVH